MEKAIDKVDVNLNQNLWFLVLSLMGLGFSEYFYLPLLLKFSFILSIFASFSVVITLIFYTINYCKNKYYNWKNKTA